MDLREYIAANPKGPAGDTPTLAQMREEILAAHVHEETLVDHVHETGVVCYTTQRVRMLLRVLNAAEERLRALGHG